MDEIICMCQICMEPMDDMTKVYRLSECNHEFHTDCIVNWFRNDSADCIACQTMINQPTMNQPTMNQQYLNPDNAQVNYDLDGQPYITFQQSKNPFAIVSRQARKKDAPESLKKLYKQYQQVRLKYATANKVYKDYKKTDDYSIYRTMRKQFRKISFKTIRMRWKMERVKEQLVSNTF
jgi:hypothetical protein